MIKKLIWGVRAILYYPFFGNIGMPSYIGPPIIMSGLRGIYLGKMVRIFPGIRMECLNGGTIHIDDNVSIAQNVHITSSRLDLRIGSGCAILANTCITNIVHKHGFDNIAPFDFPLVEKATVIGSNCLIGHGSVILAGVELGEGCIVGANSTVTKSFPAHSVVAGSPAHLLKTIKFPNFSQDAVCKQSSM